MHVAAASSRWLLVIVFALAAGFKLRGLFVGRYRWHPLVLATGLQPHATLVVGLAAAVEAATVALLIVSPPFGGALGAATVASYSLVGARHRDALPGSWNCQCLTGVLDGGTLSFFMTRNCILIGAGLLCVALPHESARAAPGYVVPVMSAVLTAWIIAARRSRRAVQLRTVGP